MTIYTLPVGLSGLKIKRLKFGQKRFDLRFQNGDSGAGQSRILAPPRWTAALVCPDGLSQAEAAIWRNLILQLQGMTHQLALPDLANLTPRGTMRGTLTLSAQANAGDTSLTITGGAGQANATLLTGDWIGIGSGGQRQLLNIAGDYTANGAGVIVVNISQPVRWQQAASSAVIWDGPTALFRQTSTDSSWDYEPGIRNGYSLDLMESWE
ncbi:hypothetical protein [Polaromonas jejuensis]|uniref:Uncharacterized protein n=1 Tax=Polaromonas jejuensis TaxID=457502 RepID=A0ABW0QH81_9BURK|nr:hypothetical protein [Polaromonas jejuensis]